MSRPKKLLNDPSLAVTEALEGLVLASDGALTTVADGAGIIRKDIAEGKVALLIGGGSGHEPMFPGFVGKNMADGSACGQIFAAPTPDIILESTKAVHRGKGVLYLYGNYSGDNMNFDIAAELAEEEGITVKTVRVWDDVAAAPRERIDDRRGIAGDLYVIKVAGGAAAECDSLDEVYRIAVKARDNVGSMGVALGAGSIPETGQLTFELGDDEIEIGMGGHGEPGVSRQKMTNADNITDLMMDLILKDMQLKAGDEVALLINNLGASTMLEMLVVNRRVRQILEGIKVKVYRTDMGAYMTSQEMAGISITLMKLDDELKHYLDLPVDSLAYSKA